MRSYLFSKKTKTALVVSFLVCILWAGIVIYENYAKVEIRAAATDSRISNDLNTASTTYVLGKRTKTENCRVNGPLPDAECTPGAVMTTDLNIICHAGTKDRRNVSLATRDKAYGEYGIIKPVNNTGANQLYEVDHLIPLELGGSNDIANLFPEAAAPTPGFHEKDKVENYLHKQVCDGVMPVEKAQYEIATNWVRYYELLTAINSSTR